MTHCCLRQGSIDIEESEVVPRGEYDKKEHNCDHWLPSTKRLMSHDACLTFCRSGAVKYAYDQCRERDLTPMKINPLTMPKGGAKTWCNYDSFIRKFHAFFCKAEGLTRSSDLAWKYMVYFKKGMGKLRKRPMKVLRIIHKKITQERNRFTVTKKIEHRFRGFLKLLRDRSFTMSVLPFNNSQLIIIFALITAYRPELKKFLTDRGVGQAPLEYLVALEQGMRAYASADRAAFGTYAYFNFEEYTGVELWRKREAYTGLVRYVLGCANYSKYVNYNWNDYVLRLKTGKTFMQRHWDITKGKVILQGLVDPEHWSQNAGVDCRRRNVKTRVTFQQPETPDVEEEEDEEEELSWDSVEEEWVKKE